MGEQDEQHFARAGERHGLPGARNGDPSMIGAGCGDLAT
jgi:hypothetical protein